MPAAPVRSGPRTGSVRSGVQSIERAFELLQALAVEPAGLTELSVRVDLPKSTVARMLGTLEGIGAVVRDGDDRTYRIGMGLVELAGAVDASAALATLVRPHLTDLADRTGEAAGFSVPTGYSMHYLVQVESPNAVQVRDYSGLTVPMHVGPSGLCVMSLWPVADVTRYLQRPLESFTPHTVNEPTTIKKRLEKIRETGYCWIHEEFAEGISSVAVPVLDQARRALGAIHVHGPTYRFPGTAGADAIARLVMDAAERVSSRAQDYTREPTSSGRPTSVRPADSRRNGDERTE
jgi:IclR family acetate operon transcriptional repressor